MGFEPKIIAFLCNWCSYDAADNTGRRQMPYPECVSIVRVMCSGRVDPQFVLEAFRDGADGVLVLGCHSGDCHYKDGNYSALKRALLLKEVLMQFGIEAKRLKIEWASGQESERFVKIVSEFKREIELLGPLTP